MPAQPAEGGQHPAAVADHRRADLEPVAYILGEVGFHRLVLKAELDAIRPLLRRRADLEPVAYILGEVGFHRIVLKNISTQFLLTLSLLSLTLLQITK